MITPEERESIVNEAVEKALLSLPEVIGNLIVDHIAMNKLNREFYRDHPEFRDHKQTVVSIIEKIDGSSSPHMDYKDKLKKAVPEIKERIKTMESLNMDSVKSNPSRIFEPLPESRINSHGKI